MANIKQPSSGVRSKPPPVRSCYILRTRPGNSIDTGSSQEGSLDKSTMSKEVSDCLSCWLTYLQMLNGLCCAGSRLSHCLASLANSVSSSGGDSSSSQLALQCQASWDELTRATSLASGLVKHHILGPLQDNAEESAQAIAASVTTFARLQKQFCYRCCELLASVISSSPSCCATNDSAGARHDSECVTAALLACFAPPPPQALPTTVATQRRWSEAAAAEMGGESSSETQRRWSMPWESSRQLRGHSNKLTVPPTSIAAGASVTTSTTSPLTHDRSRSTTPDSVWHASLASQEELHEVIELLSCRPCCSSSSQSTQLCHGSQHLPGVTLTSCSFDTPLDGSGPNTGGTCSGSRSRQGSLSPRPSWSSESPGYNWSDHEGAMATLELTPDPLISRKSSSSTDSSSNYSLQSRHSTSSEAGDPRSQLYSMWSGSDLTFIKLSESNEPADSGHSDSSKK